MGPTEKGALARRAASPSRAAPRGGQPTSRRPGRPPGRADQQPRASSITRAIDARPANTVQGNPPQPTNLAKCLILNDFLRLPTTMTIMSNRHAFSAWANSAVFRALGRPAGAPIHEQKDGMVRQWAGKPRDPVPKRHSFCRKCLENRQIDSGVLIHTPHPPG